MLKVSDDFKEHIKAQNRELTGYVKINYDRGQWNYTSYPSINPDNEELMCDDFCVCGEIGRAINYASLERDFFKLDGSFTLPSNPNINNYKWLKVTQDTSFTIPYETEENSIGVSIAFEFSINSYNTSLIKINGKKVYEETIQGVYMFIIAYVFILTISVVIISLDNLDFATSFSAVLSAMNNAGLGISKVGPTGSFSQFSILSKIVLCLDMLIGRLEIFPFLMLLSPTLWRKKF